jgi:hypothetical protein
VPQSVHRARRHSGWNNPEGVGEAKPEGYNPTITNGGFTRFDFTITLDRVTVKKCHMAQRDLSRNLPAKKYAHSQPTELRLSFEFSGNSTQFIDIARALSTINRKFVSQQAYFYVSKVELYNNEDAFVDIHTIPDTWVTKNAYRRGRALFEQMNALVDPPTTGGIVPKYYDFKVYMSDRHRSTGSADPVTYDINAGAEVHVPQEWQYTQLVSADDDGDAIQQADNMYIHMLGDHSGSPNNWTSIGLITSYQESRATTSNLPNESNVDLRDPLMNLFDMSSEEQINDIVTNLINHNDAPPYDLDVYVGGPAGIGMAQQARLVTTSTLGRTATAPGFCAPFGLICVDPQNTATAFRIVITLAPGTYHGCYAERV